MAKESDFLPLAVVPDSMVDDRAEDIASVSKQLIVARASSSTNWCSRALCSPST